MMFHGRCYGLLLFLWFCIERVFCHDDSQPCVVTWSEQLSVTPGKEKQITFHCSKFINDAITLDVNTTTWMSKDKTIPIVYSNQVQIQHVLTYLPIKARTLGEVVLRVSYNGSDCEVNSNHKIHIHVIKSYAVATISDIFGWLSFLAWGICSYPQIILHFRRRNVSGFSFDYLTLNFFGYLCYCTYNVAMFWIPEVKRLYLDQHDDEENPVTLPDVIMTMNGVFVIMVLVVQCLVYERGNQKVSKFVKTIALLLSVGLCVTLIVTSATDKIDWLQFVIYLSLVKLAITCVKYFPQVYLHYKIKSTIGWSMTAVTLDFVGGLFSLLQLFFEAGNSAEWNIILSDPTKIGLALLTMVFDIIFAFQHFILYRNNQPKVTIVNETTPLISDDDPINSR